MMAKGIIIMDIPQDCYGCSFATGYGECMVTGETVDHSPQGRRPESCPIKPVPERKCVKLNSRKRASSYVAWVKERLMNPEGETPMNLAYRLGYNRCIKDILEDNGDDKKETPDKE